MSVGSVQLGLNFRVPADVLLRRILFNWRAIFSFL